MAGEKDDRKKKMLKMYGMLDRLEESHSRSELGEELQSKSVERQTKHDQSLMIPTQRTGGIQSQRAKSPQYSIAKLQVFPMELLKEISQ